MPNSQKSASFAIIRMFIFVIMVYFTYHLFFPSIATTSLSYGELKKEVDTGNIETIVINSGGQINGKFKKPVKNSVIFRSYISPNLISNFDKDLEEKDVSATYVPESSSSVWSIISLLIMLSPIALIAYLFSKNSPNRAMSFGKSKAKLLATDGKKVTFKDVAGVDEAQEELREIVEFLSEPQKFQKLGGRIPKGVLLMGPPGTGKTLLARAVAGEANVPFFSISGSDFVEMFVGVGASRVRDLFEQGKKNAPCIVFIDEIDAVGRHRGAGLGGGHDEREQTLNQLLVEMDGFESNEGVILVAATNRPDVLDPALLRPGRFDRQVVVNKPDVRGRGLILQIHSSKIPMSEDIKLEIIARGTAGFTGADLANLVNEAALNAARYGQKLVTMSDFEFAKDKVLMGTERRSMVISEEEKKITAIHEAGHALLAAILEHSEPIHKVTIIPRGMALGLTTLLPIDEKHNHSEPQLKDMIAVLLGGRIAEEILNHGIKTTGASNDLERVTELARKMVCEWGMSERMGTLTFGKKEQQIFLGREIAQHKDYGDDTAINIDLEIKRMVMNQYNRAKDELEKHKIALQKIADELVIRETLDGEQVKKIARGEALEEIKEIVIKSTVIKSLE